MEHIVVLPKELGLTPRDFVEAWNSTQACQDAGTARITEREAISYDFGATAAAIATGIAAAALYDLIKTAIKTAIDGRDGSQRMDIKGSTQPDGTRLVVVTSYERDRL